MFMWIALCPLKYTCHNLIQSRKLCIILVSEEISFEGIRNFNWVESWPSILSYPLHALNNKILVYSAVKVHVPAPYPVEKKVHVPVKVPVHVEKPYPVEKTVSDNKIL